jgi:5-methylcytosine-specific restriction endonuclease McrA
MSRGCIEFALIGQYQCQKHHNEVGARDKQRRRANLKRTLATEQGWLCPWCEMPLPSNIAARLADGLPEVEIDHIIPRAKGGPDEDWNLQVLHRGCNGAGGKSDQVTNRALALAAEHGVTLINWDGELTAPHASFRPGTLIAA